MTRFAARATRFGVRRRRFMLCAAVTVALLFLAATGLKWFWPLPLDATEAASRLVLDRNGRVLRAFTTPGGRWRLDADPTTVNQTYLALLLAFEDRRFWKHPGVDPWALGRAVTQAVRYGHAVSGGSTLTMQVARLIRGSSTHSVWSKALQISDAFRLEASLGKRQILGLYLKLAPYGGNLEGIRAASLAYFGKEPQHLTLAEAALLVAIPQSPELRRPDNGAPAAPAALLSARNRVLRRALAAGIAKQRDADVAFAQSLPRTRREFPALAAHLAERLIGEAAPSEASIETTIDRTVQEAAEAIARRHVAALGEKLSIAALVVDHTTGEVLAHVGSAGFLDGSRLGAIDMTAAVRSPGSALKPFIYGLAFEDGLAHPETLIEDRPVRFDTYAPVNFDGGYRGTVTIRQALQLSLNVPAVKVLNEVGPAKLAARFRQAGMPFSVPHNLTVALGGTGLTLENLTALYAGLARGGTAVELRFRKDTPPPPAGAAVLLQPGAAWYVADILRGAPPPSGAQPGLIAFKTGTSYGFRDAWAAGFDGRYTIAVWVGRADGTSVPGLVGLKAAAPVLFEIFASLGARRASFAAAPPNTVFVNKAADLPPPLRLFHEQRKEVQVVLSADQPVRIAYPPANADVEAGPDASGGHAPRLVLKAEGGTLPLTWLVDGLPLESSPRRRDAVVSNVARGFVQLTVIDANGLSDRTQVRLR